MNLKVLLPSFLFLLLLAPAPALAQGPYPGEIRFLAGNYIGEPGWGECDGQWVPEDEYPELCSNLGDSYGTATEGYCVLPDARGKVLVSVHEYGGDADFDALGDSGGEKTHTLTTAEMPAHEHPYYARTNSTGFGSSGSLAHPSFTGSNALETQDDSLLVGGGQAHNNMPPYLVVSCLIYLGGASAPTATPTSTPTATNTPTATPTLTATPVITSTAVPTGTAVFVPQIYGSVYTHTLQSGNVAAMPLEANAGQIIIASTVLSICAVVVLQLIHKTVFHQ